MKRRTINLSVGLLIGLLIIFALVKGIAFAARSDLGRVRWLPDGSTLQLREVVHGWQIPRLPPDSRAIVLRFIDWDGHYIKAAEFKIPNPLYRN